MARNKKKTYAIIDIETTGGLARRDKITEIAIVLHDGHGIVDQFSSLINPERSIPYEITRITGITNEMVADAPKFYEVARQVVEMTEGAIFVAHNVRFDYSFIQEEFKRLGYTYTRKQLCTVRMSRKAFPGLRSYALGALIQHFGIHVNDRHRALEDTLATAQIFEYIMDVATQDDQVDAMINRGIREQKLPESISVEQVNELPEEAGVYYFHNEYGQVVYVGKSINIKQRVIQHFSKITRKSEAMMMQVKDISYELTGSELISLLFESEEIKSLQPIINKAQRVKDYPYFIYHYTDPDGYIVLATDKISDQKIKGKQILTHCSSLPSAKAKLGSLRDQYALCDQYLMIKGKRPSHCIAYSMEQCLGACQGTEDADDYNERATLAIDGVCMIFDKDFLIITEGRSTEERGIVLVEDKYYRGFGYMNVEELNLGIEEIKESIDYKKPNVECNQIIHTYLKNKQDCEIIEL